jgi:hypothetical protein|tara:strand:- start:154 stop:333 length:180 start_codon:yes stop_codon:yes gene_type:complete
METIKENKTIEVDSMVRLMIANDHYIGQVVIVKPEALLVRLTENMHYWAKLEELELLTP